MSTDFMPAVVVRAGAKRGEWNEIGLEMVQRPVPGPDEVMVRVEACSVNRADLLQRRGLYPPPRGESDVLGLDFAGVVLAVAPAVSRWKEGDRVFGIVPGGGYGRYLSVPVDTLVRIPDNLSFEEAAAAAEVFFTAYYNLFLQAGLKKGEVLLLHGGGSGVGTAAIQLGKVAGAEIIITAGTSEKIPGALELGAAHGINYKEEDFAARAVEVSSRKGIDVILDWIGASYLEKHLSILRTGGRLVLIGLMGGTSGEINLATVVSRRLKIIGSVLRSQSREEKAAITRGFSDEVVPLLASGRVRPVIDRTFPIDLAEDAHSYMRGGEHFGKIVLTWDGYVE
ncbi:MAG: NAD(P)H-quinone oxidoreductase [Syntrophobacteraceae bacterium]